MGEICGFLPLALVLIMAGHAMGVQVDQLRYSEFVEVHKVDAKHRNRRDTETVQYEVVEDDEKFEFSGFGRNFTLNLYRNTEFMSESFVASYEERLGTKPTQCYYHGFLEGRSTSNAVVSTCHGFNGVIR